MKTLILIFCMITFTAMTAEYDFSNTEAWGNPKTMSSVDGKLQVFGQTMLIGKEMIPLTKGKYPQIRGTYKAAAGTPEDKIWIGFIPYDKNKREIKSVNVFYHVGTETKLLEQTEAGSNDIYIEDGAKWKENGVIAYYASLDNKDIPNFNLLSGKVKYVEEISKGRWKVTLDAPVNVVIPEGVLLREHLSQGYMYVGVQNTKIGYSNPIYNATKLIWPGTRYVKFLILANWTGNKDSVLEISNSKIVILKN